MYWDFANCGFEEQKQTTLVAATRYILEYALPYSYSNPPATQNE